MKQEKIRRRIRDQPYREYTVTFLKDPPGRAEAVGLFSAHRHALCMADPFPPIVDTLSFEGAQTYLDQHPMIRPWGVLTLSENADVSDEDLSWLRYIPELKTVTLLSNKITNQGAKYLSHLSSLENLSLWSSRVTDACLETISSLRSLRSLDMQRSPAVSRAAFDDAARKLPRLAHIFPPPAPK